MKQNIRTQLLIVNTIALVLIFGSMSAYLVASSASTLRTRLKGEVASFTTLATPPIGDSYNVYGESGTDKVRSVIKSYLQENSTVTNVTIVDTQGAQLFTYHDGTSEVITPDQAGTFTPIYEQKGADLIRVIYPYFGASGAHGFNVVYNVSNDAINQAIRKESVSLLIFSLLSLLATSAVTFTAISYVILRPVRRVSEQAAIISAGNLEQQISVSGSNEIARLGAAVNAMAESLKDNIAKLQEIDKIKSEFMAITSHNLRTPLTIINSYLENIDVLNSVEDLKKALQRIGASVARLDGFAEDILTISRYELGEGHNATEMVEIKEFMQTIADETASTAQMHGLTFEYKIATDTSVQIAKPYLRSAVLNVIDNAIKFTNEGGSVHIRVFDNDGRVAIQIADSGVGIAKEEMPKLFTKFHRGTSVTQYNFEGTGIGLYASKIIIEEAGGTITAESELGKGSNFTIFLPVAKIAHKSDT